MYISGSSFYAPAPSRGREEVSSIASMKEEYKRMSLIVPPELHRAFKTACAAQGKEMTEVLLEAIRQFVAKHPSAVASPKKRGRK
jgi:hypothetical protein